MKPEVVEQKIKIPEINGGEDILIVHVGTEDRPAGPQDIKNIQELLTLASKNNALTIVTHHAISFSIIKRKWLEKVVVGADIDIETNITKI